MPLGAGLPHLLSAPSASSTRLWRELGGTSCRRRSSGSRLAACASSSMKLSIAKPVTELPTERQVDTGSLVCTGVASTERLAILYGVPLRPSTENRSPIELVENIASSESMNIPVMGPGMPGIPAVRRLLADSGIDCEMQLIFAAVTVPPSTAPAALTANTGR